MNPKYDLLLWFGMFVVGGFVYFLKRPLFNSRSPCCFLRVGDVAFKLIEVLVVDKRLHG